MLLLLTSLLSCSLTRFGYEPCTTSAECRDAFGFGSVCGEGGLCEPLRADDRCASAWPEDLLTRPESYPDVIVLGTLFDLAADEPEVQSARLAVQQVNDGGGLDGREYALVECTYEVDVALDNLEMEEATAEAALWLADQAGAAGIIGPATSSQATVAYTTLNLENAYGTLIISPSATSPALTTLDGLEKSDENPGLLWRTAPPDSLQGTVQALDMMARGTRRVAAVFEDGVYGNGLVDAFIAEFEVDGREAVRFPFSDSAQRDVAVQDAGDDGFDEVLFISGELTDMVAFLDAASQVGGYEKRPIFLADGARDVALLEGVSPDARALLPFVRGTAPSSPQGDVYETFAAAYAAAFNPDTADASSYTSYSYDAAWLAIYGTAWSWYQEGSIYGVGMARGLRRVSSGDALVLRANSWTDLRAHFQVGSSVDVQGASGELDFDPETEETSAPIDVWVVNSARTGFTTVDTYSP